MLHKAKKQNPDAVVIAVGCYVETDPARVDADDAVDLVIGNNKKSRIGQILTDFLEGRKDKQQPQEKRQAKPAFREDLTCAPAFEDMHLTSPGHTRAYIKIQDGCNQFCSYCIIPFARGRIRSRAQSEIVREVRGLVEDGIREIVLTGIHVSSYGLDLQQDNEQRPQEEKNGGIRFDPVRSGEALIRLLTALNAIEGLERIRLSSLEPRIMTETFIAALVRLEKVCPHFHLSLQSGCDETLRRMNRHYTTAEFAHSVELLRRYYDRPAVTTDVIVGFPGETEEEFAATCAFLEKIRFYEIHVFRYSRRNGTVAARLPDQVPESVKAVRSDRLLAMTAAQAAEFRAQFEGERETILLEEICEYKGERFWTGSTARYVTGAVAVRDAAADGMPGRGTAGTQGSDGPADLRMEPGMLLAGSFCGGGITFSRGPAMFFVPDAGKCRQNSGK